MNANKRMQSGISIREEQVRNWFDREKFNGEYLLVSTKPDSIYSKKLAGLKPDQKLIIDLYTPIFLEKELSLSKWNPNDWVTRFRNREMVKKFLRRGSHFLVANQRQRDYWLETSKSLGVPLKLNDISVLPTGALSTIHHQPLTISSRNVVLWFGGIYPWMDPLPLIEAFGTIAKKFPDWKLRFLGGFHPDTGYENLYQRIVSVAKLKIPNSQLELIPWQEEKKLDKYFTDVAFAVHLVKVSPEDYFAHRVRLLTLLSAGVPVLTSGQDIISDLAVRLGAMVRTELDRGRIEKDLIDLINSVKQLDKMRRFRSRVERTFLKQETDIRLNDSNHLTSVIPDLIRNL